MLVNDRGFVHRVKDPVMRAHFPHARSVPTYVSSALEPETRVKSALHRLTSELLEAIAHSVVHDEVGKLGIEEVVCDGPTVRDESCERRPR